MSYADRWFKTTSISSKNRKNKDFKSLIIIGLCSLCFCSLFFFIYVIYCLSQILYQKAPFLYLLKNTATINFLLTAPILSDKKWCFK